MLKMASLTDRLEEEIKVITGRKRRPSAGGLSSFGQKINQNQNRARRVSI